MSPDNELDRPYHKVSNLFPLLQGEEFELLKADIAANGLLEPIWLHPDGSIIDGRNRHRACIETQTPPRFRTWDNKGSLVTFVVSLNLHRRHLSSSQRAAISLNVLPMLEEEARDRQGQRTDLNFQEIIPESSGQARDQAAILFNTNPRYVSDAKRIQEEDPGLLDRVRDGSITIPEANKILKERVAQEQKERMESSPIIESALPTEPIIEVRLGDLWQLGNHLLMCGDSYRQGMRSSQTVT